MNIKRKIKRKNMAFCAFHKLTPMGSVSVTKSRILFSSTAVAFIPETIYIYIFLALFRGYESLSTFHCVRKYFNLKYYNNKQPLSCKNYCILNYPNNSRSQESLLLIGTFFQGLIHRFF